MSFRITLACASALFALCMTGKAHAAPSNFQNSCNNIHIHQDHSDAWITATCQTRDGDTNDTRISIPGIENQDGRLVPLDNPRARSTFAETCPKLTLHWDHEHVVLSGTCKDRDGNLNGASDLDIDNIENNNGFLRLR